MKTFAHTVRLRMICSGVVNLPRDFASVDHSTETNRAPVKNAAETRHSCRKEQVGLVEDKGNASGHLVVRSIIVNRCVKPNWDGEGPTRSTCTW